MRKWKRISLYAAFCGQLGITYFYHVLNDKIKVEPFGLYALENNVCVVEILDAACKSVQQGKTVYFK